MSEDSDDFGETVSLENVEEFESFLKEEEEGSANENQGVD